MGEDSVIKILVVDDDEMVVELLKDVIKIRFDDANVYGVCKGSDAIRHLDEDEYDLVISDIMIPDMSGYEIAIYMQKQDIKTPILFMTGASLDKVIPRISFDNHKIDFIEKPFNMQQLIEKIKQYVEN